MPSGNLALVERWLSAINHADLPALLDLTDENIEIVGPRGSGHGKDLPAQWLARAGFSAEPVRWFCGANGTVVVEQVAHWSDPGAPDSASVPKRVSSCFAVRGQRVARFQRFDELDAALVASGLRLEDEVLERR